MILLLGAIVVVILAQLLPQLCAEHFPVQFLNAFGSIVGTYLAMLFEYSGLVHCAYIFRNLLIFFAERWHLRQTAKRNRQRFKNHNVAVALEIDLELSDSDHQQTLHNRNVIRQHIRDVDVESEVEEEQHDLLNIREKRARSHKRTKSLQQMTENNFLDHLDVLCNAWLHFSSRHQPGEVTVTNSLLGRAQSEVNLSALDRSQVQSSFSKTRTKFPILIGNRAYASPATIVSQLLSQNVNASIPNTSHLIS